MGTITLMAQSADPSATSTPNLFPTTTAGRSDPGIGGPGSANVYYLVVCPLPFQRIGQGLMTVPRCSRHHSDASCVLGI
jgi:hypothetical protein